MSKGFKKIIIPMLILILISALSILYIKFMRYGTSVDKELLNMINIGQSIAIEVSEPGYEIEVVGEPAEEFTWVQLDRLKTYNNGFRQDFDKIFNINIITENGEPGKNGCLFVGEDGHRDGNTTLEDAFRNKSFVNKYWNDEKTQRELSKVSSEAYVDAEGNYKIVASLNAYYNLLPDNINPASFNPTQSLTREQFMSLIFRSEEGVQDITVNKDFENAVGGSTEYTKYAQGIDQYSWLNTENKGLDEVTYKGSITRAEAVYLIVNKHFSEELIKLTKEDTAYSDTKNAGDLASKVGFKEKEDNSYIGKEKWQSYVLAYMTEHPEAGMQEELYNSLVVAHKLGLLEGNESRWDEPLSKSEAIQLIINTHLAKNSLYGFLTEVEYGEMVISRADGTESNQKSIDTEKVTGEDENGLKQGDGWAEVPEGMVPADPNKKLNHGFTLAEAKELVDIMMKQLGVRIYDARIKKVMKDLGTTPEELESLEEGNQAQQPVETAKPAETAKPVKPNKPETKPTSPPAGDGNTGNNGNTDSQIPPEYDKDGNGRLDSIEQYQGPLGPSEYDGNDPGEGKLH